MELLQSKIPFAPNWTVARGARYVVKLTAFVLVPGLHQMGCRRWILGGLLFVLYVVSLFIPDNAPIVYPYEHELPDAMFARLADIAQYSTWLLLAIDWKKIDRRSLKPALVLLIPGLAAYLITQHHDRRLLHMHIERANSVCPAFCRNDIVEWDFYNHETEKVSKGDYVVLDGGVYAFHTTKILSDPVTQACATDDRTALQLPVGNEFCELKIVYPGGDAKWMTFSGISYAGRRYCYYYDFLVADRLSFAITQPVKYTPGRRISMTSRLVITGVRPRKFGDARDYFVASDEVTNHVARTLLFAYKWTGINIFEMLKK